MTVPVLAYHHVGNGPQMSITWVTRRGFEAQIRHLATAGYRSLTVQQLGQPSTQPHRRHVAITFDDAYTSVLEHAFPILHHYGFVATVFVIAGYVGEENKWDVCLPGMRSRHLDEAGLRALVRAGWEVGSHTLTHPKLTEIGPEACWAELHESKRLLEAKLGTPVQTVAFPFSRYNSEVVALAREAGYRSACTLDGQGGDPGLHDGFLIRRRGVYVFDRLSGFVRKVESTHISTSERWRQRLIHFCAQGTWWARTRLRRQKGLAIFRFIS